MKPLTYYIDTDATRSFSEHYGSNLQEITFIEQLTLASIISQFLAAIADDTDEYDLLAAADDSPLEQTEEVRYILERLQSEISEPLLIGFLLAISNFLYEAPPIVFDRDRYDIVKTALFEDGMDAAVAQKAALVIGADYPCLPRTQHAQDNVATAWQQFKGYYTPKDVLEPLFFPDDE
ncbi:hypothetical protein H6F43_06945 [Leptolyngbya sp. FACHB-36]|uniref:hypothetical protein n=1 Tax=Leptolyngbya sp. FACHB-36 TaxID=2692808 RepID=UPI00168120A2|nr:hypothetical protein [Leptolyngbya sp. FACHB-36]MBD2019923.1 hypothetical protein [Leptolyngbya sp. FACHB-36]